MHCQITILFTDTISERTLIPCHLNSNNTYLTIDAVREDWFLSDHVEFLINYQTTFIINQYHYQHTDCLLCMRRREVISPITSSSTSWAPHRQTQQRGRTWPGRRSRSPWWRRTRGPRPTRGTRTAWRPCGTSRWRAGWETETEGERDLKSYFMDASRETD